MNWIHQAKSARHLLRQARRRARLLGAVLSIGIGVSVLISAPAALAAPAHVAATAAAKPPPPFRSFIASTRRATYAQYAGRKKTGGVESAAAFRHMRSYILELYRGVHATSLFNFQGSTFDCVTVMSQPTVTDLHIKRLAAKPAFTSTPPITGKSGGHGSGQTVTSPLALGLTDAFGDHVSCRSGTVPMKRITLGALTRFPTLSAFLVKDAPRPAGPTYSQPHRHAYVKQSITNYGGNSWLNLWNPAGDFSLSQQWYVGGTGGSLQTVEGGWVHYPSKFGSNSVLFIYRTAADYSSGSGCWDLDCSGFVQINNGWALGAGFTEYSTDGGTQWGFQMQWKYYRGNWWLFLPESGSMAAIGYYPGSLYHSGPLATNASVMEAGGEVCNSPSGNSCTNPDWPQMGSGKYAATGFGHAAFQKQVFYIPKDENGGTGVWTSLSAISESPKCYSAIATPASSGGTWGSYFFFGGPGGVGC